MFYSGKNVELFIGERYKLNVTHAISAAKLNFVPNNV